MAGKYLIAGLGNIGPEYAATRHNVGFMVLDNLIEGTDTIFNSDRLAFRATMSYRGRELFLIKPTTYMNLSGRAISYWLQKESIPIENLLVICDDIAIPFGTLRMKKKGSDGGHNGLANIAEFLESFQFARLRVGVGKDFHPGEQIDYVLGTFTDEQVKLLPSLLSRACQAIKDFVFIGPDRAMNICNTKPIEEKPEE